MVSHCATAVNEGERAFTVPAHNRPVARNRPAPRESLGLGSGADLYRSLSDGLQGHS